MRICGAFLICFFVVCFFLLLAIFMLRTLTAECWTCTSSFYDGSHQEGVETKAKQISWDNNGWRRKREEKGKKKTSEEILQFYFSLIQNKCSGFSLFFAGILPAVVGVRVMSLIFLSWNIKQRRGGKGLAGKKRLWMLCMERECGSYEDFPRKHGDKLQGLGSSKVWWGIWWSSWSGEQARRER